MGKLLMLLASAGLLLGGAYLFLESRKSSSEPVRSGAMAVPLQTMDRMKDKARDIERETQQRADQLMRQSGGSP